MAFLTVMSLAVGLLALIIASATDIKTREVPDWLNYSLIAFSIGSALILSLYYGYAHIFINALIGLLAGAAFGLLMFYTGQWGGGDAKLIMGLAGLIGLNISGPGTGFPLLIVFVINLLLVGAVYGLIFSFWLGIKNFKKLKKEAEKKMRSKQMIRFRIILLIIMVAGFAYFLYARNMQSIFLFAFAALLFIMFYLWMFISMIEQVAMIKRIPVAGLTEGDWIVEPVKKHKKLVYKPSKTGISLEDIKKLKKNRIRSVMVKIGIPFVPSFLVAYVLTFSLGNWLFAFLAAV